VFVAGAYQPETSMSFAIRPIDSPNASAMSLFHVQAIITAAGNPIEPWPVKLLLIEAGPSQSYVITLPIESTADVSYPPSSISVFISETVSSSRSVSHIGSS